MTGEVIKKKLLAEGCPVSQLAEKLCTSQQNLSMKLSKGAVKTDLLEQICDVLNKDMSFFYGGTKYLPESTMTNDKDTVPLKLFEKILYERDEWKDRCMMLQNQISDMQAGMSEMQILKRTK